MVVDPDQRRAVAYSHGIERQIQMRLAGQWTNLRYSSRSNGIIQLSSSPIYQSTSLPIYQLITFRHVIPCTPR